VFGRQFAQGAPAKADERQRRAGEQGQAQQPGFQRDMQHAAVQEQAAVGTASLP
jgi:hypothetical protein